MRWRALGLIAVLFLSAGAFVPTGAFAAPAVVASIVPVHALVAGVMEGVGAPFLLLRGAASPHAYALKPSEARAVAEAERLFWIGPPIESFLPRVVEGLAPGTSVALAERAGLTLLPPRDAGPWQAPVPDDREHREHEPEHHDDHAHDDREPEHHDDHAHHDHAHDDAHDWHVWLDPTNAARMAAAIADELRAVDPANGPRYRANAAALAARLETLDRALRAALEPVRAVPYVVFHDAYRYFEARYGTNAVGAITVNPERPPSARRLAEVRARIIESGARCVFAEPQFPPRVVAAIVEGTEARRAVLDPLGADLEPGADAYFSLMRALADSLVHCLSR